MLYSLSPLLFIGLSQAVASEVRSLYTRDGASPSLPYDVNTSKYCSWWTDNPSITPECGNLIAGKSYCVEAVNEPAFSTSPVSTPIPQPTSIPSTSTKPTVITTFSKTIPTTPTAIASSTTPGNGFATPQPTQPGMVTNCNKFHWIAKGVVCSQVISYQKITLEDFVKWNPTVGNDCTGMWAEVNVCVGVIGGDTTTVKASSTTTATKGNGIQTPLPTQPGMVTNCNKFHWIAKGVVCSQVISYNKITRADFIKWNPTVGDDCSGMWAEVNVCVGVMGGTTPTPTTSAGNGIQTPQPTQPGMVANCKKFHYVDEGVICSQITSYHKLSLADFVKWNPGVGSDCKSMWAKSWVCVGV